MDEAGSFAGCLAAETTLLTKACALQQSVLTPKSKQSFICSSLAESWK